MSESTTTTTEPETNGEVAKVDSDVEEKGTPEKKPSLDPDWEHDRFDYKGDNLAVRVPTMQALAAFQLSSSKYISSERQNDISGLFIDQHLGPDSYDRVMYRMMDGDDPDYDTKTIADLMGELVHRAVEVIKDQAEKEAEAKKRELESKG